MMPMKPQNLTSTTTSQGRRSFHWVFGNEEFDVSISKNGVFFEFKKDGNSAGCFGFDRFWSSKGLSGIEYLEKKWLRTDERSMKILSWFGNTSDIIEFIKYHQNEINTLKQAELDL